MTIRYTLRQRADLAANSKKDGFDLSLSDACRLFRQRFAEWRKAQCKHMPRLPLPEEEALLVPSDDEQDDCEEILALPSDFSSDELDTYELRPLGMFELKLRVGLAFDLLRDVRQAVQHSVVHLDEKKQHATSKKAHLREQSKIDVSRNLSYREAERYNHNFSRIQTLRQLLSIPAAPNHMESNLRQINLKNDLKMVNLIAGRSRGDTSLLAEGSWIWSVSSPPASKRVQPDRKGKAQDVSAEEEAAPSWTTKGAQCKAAWYTKECSHKVAADCTHWHRTRMAKTQADTYANYTCADFRHTRNGFDCLCKCWLAAAEDDAALPGERAYAYQQADMYARMRDACQAAYDRVRKPGVDGAELDHTLVRSVRESVMLIY